LADQGAGFHELDLRKLGGAAVEGVDGDLGAGGDDAAEVLAVVGDDVVGDRGAEVDDDAAATQALEGGDRVDEAVGADLARVVHADRHAGPQTGPDNQHLVTE